MRDKKGDSRRAFKARGGNRGKLLDLRLGRLCDHLEPGAREHLVRRPEPCLLPIHRDWDPREFARSPRYRTAPLNTAGIPAWWLDGPAGIPILIPMSDADRYPLIVLRRHVRRCPHDGARLR